LSAILETLPATAKGICIIEVHGKKMYRNLKRKLILNLNGFIIPTSDQQ
jgi:NADPH-dependent ferric siderophore reductase